MTPERWAEVERLCHEALALPVHQRAPFLSEACGKDEPLLLELESLLAQESRIGDFMTEPATPPSRVGGALAGRRFGPYAIDSLVGEGGMGEVYKATDTRLNRVVAIKVLPAVVRDDVERRQRFEREAKTLASLSHPHICPIYDVGDHDGIAFLVMEYLQGQTLAHRLAKERLSLDLVLRYAIQIAEALAAAHQQGVIRRDLKPGNIMLTKAGAMLLDFGLAKLQGAESAGWPLLFQSARLSGPGILLGTPQYMAPEQVEGKEADARSDIYSFGAIVYEMATGTSGCADASRDLAPPALDRIVKACLARDPDERWQNAGDLARELRWIADGSVDHGVPVRRSAALVALAIAALAALGSFATWRMLQPEPVEQSVLSIMTPGRTVNPFQIAISPDGRLVAFVAAGRDGETRLFVRPIASERPEELGGTEGAFQPFWSPDSRSIGFAVMSSMKLMRVEVHGGPPLPIADLERSFLGGTWSAEGAIVFGDRGRLRRVSATGGPATTVGIEHTQAAWRWPHFLPDGRHFLFVAFAMDGSRSVYVGSLDSDELKQIMPSESMVAYASPGVLLFVREGTLVAQPFDVDRLELTGDQIPLAYGVLANDFGRAAFAVSNRGTLIYRTGQRGKWWQWLNRSGGVSPIRTPIETGTLRLAPDGKRVAFSRIDGTNEDIWIHELDSGVTRKLTNDPAHDHWPVWAPDGSRLAFNSNRTGSSYVLYEKPETAVTPEQVLLQPEAGFWYGVLDWSLDDRFMLLVKGPVGRQQSRPELWVMPRFGDRKPFRFPSAPFGGHAALSPNGRWIAYTSDDTGKNQVVVQSFPDPTRAQRQITRDGGQFPRWRRDGRELYYVDDGKIFAVPVTTTADACEFGTATDLFGVVLTPGPGPYLVGPSYPYDVTGDGQRFLVSAFPLADDNASITVVTNWTARLKR